MALRIPVTGKDFASWLRQAAPSLNASQEYPFEVLSAAPSNPAEGRVYYDLSLHKPRVWDGSAWQNFY